MMQRFLDFRKGLAACIPALGALFTAILASTCCIAPFLAIAGWFGATVAQLAWLASIKTYLILLSLIAIAYSLHKAYRKPNVSLQIHCCQLVDSNRQRAGKFTSVLSSKSLLWVIALITFLTLLVPYVADAQAKKAVNKEAQVMFHVGRFSQSCCSVLIEFSLKKVTGYHKMKADASKRQVIVWYNPAQTNPKVLKAAIDKSGYLADILKQ